MSIFSLPFFSSTDNDKETARKCAVVQYSMKSKRTIAYTFVIPCVFTVHICAPLLNIHIVFFVKSHHKTFVLWQSHMNRHARSSLTQKKNVFFSLLYISNFRFMFILTTSIWAEWKNRLLISGGSALQLTLFSIGKKAWSKNTHIGRLWREREKCVYEHVKLW